MVRVTYPGGYGKANVGISNDKEGKIPSRRKTKVSRAMSITPGFFSPFLHSTRSLSVSREYLALPDGPGGFAQNSSCSALLRIPLGFNLLRVPDCHRLWSFFPERSSHKHRATAWSYNPMVALPQSWFGLFPVRSPLLGESLTYFLFLQVLRCFSSLR
jgi:hypothetical protein